MDGKTALEKAWKSDIPKATSLQCVKHFEGNCKAELHKIGIREKKSQKFFLTGCLGFKERKKELLTLKTKKKLSRNSTSFEMGLTRKRWKYFKRIIPISPGFQNT